MAMAWVWTLMVTASVVFGLINGTVGAVGNAALEGAAAAVELCLHMAHKKVIYVATVCIIGAIIICCIPYLFHLFLN